MNKFEFVSQLIKNNIGESASPSLLDVGCRGCELKNFLPTGVQYDGADLFQNDQKSVKYVTNVEKGLPIADGSYDYVVALDLLEHLNDIEFGIAELARISKKHLIILLPNMAHFSFRFKFLFKGSIGAKYRLEYGMGLDRHRWLTVIPETDHFVKTFAEKNHFKIETFWFNDSPKKKLAEMILKRFGFKPGWWAWGSIYHLTK
jgi:SAM-dependent methyltransferase